MMKKVLLIDDDSINNFINKKMIENTGLANEILVANNGRQGIEILLKNNSARQRQPDLILLDINMPIMDGFEFLEAFNALEFEERNSIRIAVLSSSYHADDKSKARELGIKDYLTKPVDFDALLSILT